MRKRQQQRYKLKLDSQVENKEGANFHAFFVCLFYSFLFCLGCCPDYSSQADLTEITTHPGVHHNLHGLPRNSLYLMSTGSRLFAGLVFERQIYSRTISNHLAVFNHQIQLHYFRDA